MKKLLIALAAVLITSTAADAQVLLRGDIWYGISGKRFHLEADALTNFESTPTDRLRFRVWASEHHWQQYNPGRVVAAGGLPRLLENQTRFEIHSTVPMHYPHSDWYYITVTVEERSIDSGGKVSWTIRDIIYFDEIYLRDPHDWWRPFPF